MKFLFKTIVVTLLIFAVLLVAIIFTPDNLVDNTTQPQNIPVVESQYEQKTLNNVTYSIDTFNDIYIASFTDPIELLYDNTEPTSFRKNSENNNFLLSINGGYFTESLTHAGLLAMGGEIIEPIARNDIQVSHIVLYNTQSNSVDILLAKDFNLNLAEKPNMMAFQTGPLIIQSNIVQYQYIEDSLNGTGKHKRSLFGFTDDGTKFFIATKKTYDLKTLSDLILKFPFFENKKITVVNLDGGSSVAIYSKDNEDFIFGTARELPIIIGVP